MSCFRRAGYLREVSRLCPATRRPADRRRDPDRSGPARARGGAVEQDDVVPDILLVGKGLSGGVVPVAAMVATPEAYAPFAADPYLHTSTFAGSPLASAAARAAVDDDPRRAHRRARGHARGAAAPRAAGGVRCADGRPAWSTSAAGACCSGSSSPTRVRSGELALQLIEHGVLSCHSLNSTRVLRFTPPAVLDDSEIDTFLRAFSSALTACDLFPNDPPTT